MPVRSYLGMRCSGQLRAHDTGERSVCWATAARAGCSHAPPVVDRLPRGRRARIPHAIAGVGELTQRGLPVLRLLAPLLRDEDMRVVLRPGALAVEGHEARRRRVARLQRRRVRPATVGTRGGCLGLVPTCNIETCQRQDTGASEGGREGRARAWSIARARHALAPSRTPSSCAVDIAATEPRPSGREKGFPFVGGVRRFRVCWQKVGFCRFSPNFHVSLA